MTITSCNIEFLFKFFADKNINSQPGGWQVHAGILSQSVICLYCFYCAAFPFQLWHEQLDSPSMATCGTASSLICEKGISLWILWIDRLLVAMMKIQVYK